MHIPNGRLRSLQLEILKVLLNNFEVPDYLWAFERGKSIPDMAALHVGKKWVISLDLENFFGRVHVKHIVPMLVGKGIDPKSSRIIAELCTYKYFLPQGGITSPKLSNLVTANTFGPPLKAFCDKEGLTLTVYADDITVSTDKPLELAQVQEITNKISQ
ncbi:MAG TPA: reverse transcriptase family protein, partial [Methanosarcina sp.]|nr:reverse transcriptase family protein [Methanosarcina sp.]